MSLISVGPKAQGRPQGSTRTFKTGLSPESWSVAKGAGGQWLLGVSFESEKEPASPGFWVPHLELFHSGW